MNWKKELNNRPFRTMTIVIGICGGLTIVATMTGLITTPFRTVGGVIERTANPDNVIANYEWFKRQHQDVKAMDVRLSVGRKTLETFTMSVGPRETWKFEDRQEFNRLNGIIQGLEGQRAAMVAEYNARTEMLNRNIFKTSDLPATLN